MDIVQLRAGWTEVLDLLERKDRIAWLAFFDARLASVSGSTLVLDYSDSRKLASNHEYSSIRNEHRLALKDSIQEVFGIALEIVEKV